MENNQIIYRSFLLSVSLLLIFSISSCSLIFTSKPTNSPQPQAANDIKATAEFIEAKKHIITGNYEQAEHLLKLYVTDYKNDHAAHYELADVYRIKNNLGDATKHIEKAVALDKENIWYQLLMAEIDFQNANFKRAIKTYESLFEQSNNQAYLEQIALIHESRQDFGAAISIYNQIEKTFGPSESIGMIKYDLYQKTANYNSALKEIEKLSISFPDQIRYKTLLAEKYLQQGRAVDAKKMIDATLALNPQDPASQFLLAEYFSLIGDTKKAYSTMEKTFLNQAIDVDPKIGVLLNLYDKGNDPITRQHTLRLLKAVTLTHPQEPKAWAMFADYMFRDRNYEGARNAFRKTIALDSLKYDVWEQLLLCNNYLNDFASLTVESSRALEIFPDQAILYLFQAIGLREQQKNDKALESIKKGLYFTSEQSKTGKALLEIRNEILKH